MSGETAASGQTAASGGGGGGDVPAGTGRVIDTSVAHSARVHDYWLGGKDNISSGTPVQRSDSDRTSTSCALFENSVLRCPGSVRSLFRHLCPFYRTRVPDSGLTLLTGAVCLAWGLGGTVLAFGGLTFPAHVPGRAARGRSQTVRGAAPVRWRRCAVMSSSLFTPYVPPSKRRVCRFTFNDGSSHPGYAFHRCLFGIRTAQRAIIRSGEISGGVKGLNAEERGIHCVVDREPCGLNPDKRIRLEPARHGNGQYHCGLGVDDHRSGRGASGRRTMNGHFGCGSASRAMRGRSSFI